MRRLALTPSISTPQFGDTGRTYVLQTGRDEDVIKNSTNPDVTLDINTHQTGFPQNLMVICPKIDGGLPDTQHGNLIMVCQPDCGRAESPSRPAFLALDLHSWHLRSSAEGRQRRSYQSDGVWSGRTWI